MACALLIEVMLKAYEICSSLFQKKKIEKKRNIFSSYKLPKLQLTSFWFEGLLGGKVKEMHVC
jgi:hypothetical protein